MKTLKLILLVIFLLSILIKSSKADGLSQFMMDDEPKTIWKLELIEKGYIPTEKIIFVIDTSGSMSGAAYQNAKLAVDYIVQNQSLDKDYFVKIYAFQDDVTLWRKKWTPMPHPEEWAQAIVFLNKFRGIGNTNIAKAVITALKENNKDEICVFLISDGHPSKPRDEELKEILKARGKSPTVIHTVFIHEYGLIEAEKSQEFMHKLAKETGGNFVIIKQKDPNSDKPF